MSDLDIEHPCIVGRVRSCHLLAVDEHVLADFQVAPFQCIGDFSNPGAVRVLCAWCCDFAAVPFGHVNFNHLVGDFMSVIVLGQVCPFSFQVGGIRSDGDVADRLAAHLSDIADFIGLGIASLADRIFSDQAESDVPAQAEFVILIIPDLGCFDFGGHSFVRVGQLGQECEHTGLIRGFFLINRGYSTGIADFRSGFCTDISVIGQIISECACNRCMRDIRIRYGRIKHRRNGNRSENHLSFNPAINIQITDLIILVNAFNHMCPVIDVIQNRVVCCICRIIILVINRNSRYSNPLACSGRNSVIIQVVLKPLQDHFDTIRPYTVAVVLIIPGFGYSNTVFSGISINEDNIIFRCLISIFFCSDYFPKRSIINQLMLYSFHHGIPVVIKLNFSMGIKVKHLIVFGTDS